MLVYKVTNITNGKVYIGQTVKTLEERRRTHYHAASCKTRPNVRHFIHALRKNSKSDFIWECVFISEHQELIDDKEIELISKYQSTNHTKGYNIQLGGKGGKHSEETKVLIGQAQIGKLNHAYGKCGKLSKSSKPVINLVTKEVFESANLAAKHAQDAVSKVCQVCRGERFWTKGQVYRYLDDMMQPIKLVPPKGRGDVYYNKDDNKLFLTALSIYKSGLYGYVGSSTPQAKKILKTLPWQKVTLGELDDMLISVPSENIFS